MSFLTPDLPARADHTARADLQAQADALNARFRHHSAHDVMQHALHKLGHIALVSSFGAESVVLLHMAARVDKGYPVLFLDTEMLFEETLAYQQEVTQALGLTSVLVLRAGDSRVWDPSGTLHQSDTDACCALRKTAPLQNALRSFDGWITGRKRFQARTRAALDFFEVDPAAPRLKINPLAHWMPQDVQDYMIENRLPRHPLVAQGYPSIGCAPCTSPVSAGEDSRAGRWRKTEKEECGIHFVDGKMVRTGVQT